MWRGEDSCWKTGAWWAFYQYNLGHSSIGGKYIDADVDVDAHDRGVELYPRR